MVPFITVEGPIGVGKTSLSRAISERYQYHLLKEIVEDNPYLSKLYTNISEWSFQTEMFFLCNRYKQLETIHFDYLEDRKPVVADYHILKSTIFSKMTLSHQQHRKFKKVYDILTADMPRPNVVIYLNASVPTLLKRIEIRGRDFEKNIDPSYLEELSRSYELVMRTFEKEQPHIPVLRLNGDEIDFVHKEQDMQFIFHQLDDILQRRKNHE